ncbi:MAG: tape measure protein, partial [Caldilineaceae bacterium]
MPATVKRTVTTRYTLDAKGALKDLRSIAQTSAATAKGLGRTNESLNRLNKTAQRTESSINRLGKQFGFLKNMVVAWLSYKSLDYFKSISDAATDTEVRLRGLAGQFESAASAADVGGQIFEDLKEQALEVGTGVDTLAETYAKLAYAVPTAEHEELIGVTKTLSDTLAKTGASTQQVNAVLLQMAQGLGTGALQGDEFKSVLENAPALLYAWQEALGKTSVGIKTLSENADLTTESFIELYPEIQRLVEEMTGVEEVPITFGRAFENLRTVLIGLFQDLSGEGSGSVFQPLAEGLNDMALALDKLTPKIKSALGELAVFGPAAQEAGRLALRAFDGMVEGAKAVVEVMVRANVAAIGGSESDPRGNPFHPDYLSNLAMETEKELATIEVLYEYTRDALTVTFTGIWESFKENFGEPIIEFFKDLPRLFKEAMQFVSDLLSAAAKDLLDIWNSEAMEPLRAAFEKIAGFFKEYVIEPIMEMWDVLTGWIAEKWEQFNPFSNGSVDAGTPIAAPGSQFGAAESWAEVAFTAGAKSGWDKVDEQLRAEASRLARDLEAIGIEVTVTSGYRSGSGSSQHNYGNALDWVLSDWEKARDYMRQHGDKYALRFPVKDEGPEDWSARTYGRSKNGTPEHWHVQLDETKARVENFAEAVEETNDKVTELGENAATELKRRWEEIEARHAEAANRPATEGAEAALERIDIGNRKVSASTSELTKATQEQTKAEKSAVKEREKLAKAVEDLRQEYDPLRKLQKDYEAQIKTINRAEADGLITLQEKNTLLQQANDAYRAAKQEGMEEYRKGIESLKSADDARHEAMLKHREELAMLTEAYNKGVIPSLAEFEELVQVSRDRYDQSLATIVAEEAEAAQVKLEEVVGKLYTLQDGYRDLVQNMR